MSNKNQENLDKREPYWDNVKGLLIILVVLGHFLWDFRDQGFARYLVDFIYVFHMPAFVFVAGYLSKSKRSKSNHAIQRLFVIYFIFNTALMLFGYLSEGTPLVLFTPYYSSWFIISLLTWRLIIKLIEKFPYLLFLSIIAAILVGFWGDISNILSISRTVAFFPFFVFGYKFSGKKLTDVISNRTLKDYFLGVLLFILGIILSSLFFNNYPELSDLNFSMSVYLSWFDVYARIIVFCIAGLMIRSILLFTPKKSIPLLTKWGKNSLSIYIIHRFVTLFFSKIFIPIKYVDYYILYACLATLLTVLLLGSDFISAKFNVFIDFIQNKIIDITTRQSLINQSKKSGFLLVVILIAILMTPMLVSLFPSSERVTSNNLPEDIIHQIISEEQSDDIENAFSIAFVGDLILLEDQVKSAYSDSRAEYDFNPMFEYAKDYLSEADLAIGVLEGPIAGKEEGFSSGNYDDNIPLYLNFPDEFPRAIKNSGIDLVTTANNHVLDKGVKGAVRTLDVLDEIGMLHVGSYRNINEKESVFIIEEKGLRIAFLAYTFGSNYYSEDYFINEKPYITSILVDPKSKNFDLVKKMVLSDFQRIKQLNDPPDLIVVLPHIGTQFSHETDDFQETWNRIFMDAGADIILGDHSHAVQPIEFQNAVDIYGQEKTVLVVNSPGNFANSYVEHNGDATAIIEVYIDLQKKEIVSAGVIPMYTYSSANGSYLALPIYDILNDSSLSNLVSVYEMDRIAEVQNIVTSVMLQTELTLDQVQDRYYLFADGYFRQPVKPIEITPDMTESKFYEVISQSQNICFIGDSITAGTKNGGYGWFEPFMAAFPDKTFSRQAWGSATTITLLENIDSIKEQFADLYVIAIGTNDVRYRDEKICAMDSATFVDNIDHLIRKIAGKNPNAEFVLISPWFALDNDPLTKIPPDERDYLLNEYGKELETYSLSNGYLYVNPNKAIKQELSAEVVSKYLLDYIHPNANNGIALYSQAALEYLGEQ